MAIIDHDVKVGAEGPIVVLVVDGRAVRMPWQKAEEISRALHRKAREAEEIDKANTIIYDNAFLQRSGALPGIGLSDNPKIIEETVKESQYNKVLRKQLNWRDSQVSDGLGGIRSRGAVGAPIIGKA